MHKISVIIPVLNEERNLGNILRCLKAQKGVLLDIIVSDASSKDKSKKIAKKYGAKVVKGGLPAVGRNNGAKFAKYEKIVFLDADVTFPKTFIRDCLGQMEKGRIEIASVLTKPNSKRILDKILFSLWDFWIWATQKIFPHAPGYCIFSSKRIHKKIKGFDEGIRLAEDANYVLRASKIGRFGILRIPINTSVRRLDTEGRWGMFKKMLLCGFYRMFKGEDRSNRFSYEFKHR